MENSRKRYRAFISYSQENRKYAKRLQQALETYQLPNGFSAQGNEPDTRKLGRFFRDEEEMGAASDLGEAVRGAIADSESLIVICSPAAARSKWVNAEVLHFRRTGRSDKIFAVIIDGQPNTGVAETECFPPALRSANETEDLASMPIQPLAIDFRKEGRARTCARLAAGLLNTNFDDLWNRDKRRRKTRLIQFAAIASGLLFLVLVAEPAARTANMYFNYRFYVEKGKFLTFMESGTSFQDCRDGSKYCPVMVLLPEGEFMMGSREDDPEAYENEIPQHRVSIQKFAVSKYEITFAEWRECVVAGGCPSQTVPAHVMEEQPSNPVVNVSWHDVQEYAAWLSRMTGQHYRLLTEAEWEYAARAITSMSAPQTRFSWGMEDPVCDPTAANGAAFSTCPKEGSYPVGSFPANAFGLHDMHGNVFEWVEDCFVPSYAQASNDGSAVLQGDCAERVLRGGAWGTEYIWGRSGDRSHLVPVTRHELDGFRIARTVSSL